MDVRKRDRKTWFKRKERRPFPSPTSSGRTSPSTASSDYDIDGYTYDDKKRSRSRYIEAVRLLEEAVKEHGGPGGTFNELSGEPKNFSDSLFRERINAVLEAQRSRVKDQSILEKCQHTIQCAFTAFSPFAKNFLSIAKDALSVLLVLYIAYKIDYVHKSLWLALRRPSILDFDRELGRKKELGETLDHMCQQLEHLAILTSLPEDLEQREFVINRALDVRSACMLYLTANIRHQSTFLGVPGRVIKVFFAGDAKITDSKTYFDKCVANYSRAINDIVGVHTILKVWEVVKGMATLNVRRPSDERIEDKFLVPYEENPRFTGRIRFMESLRQKLSATFQNQFNHRVALYGMGGIGKTQCALKYVYSFRESYERVYWITAVDRAALLSGYQTIAKEAKLPGLKNSNPIEIAGAVRSWLKQEPSWLIVFDNLDDIRVADGLLPENGPGKHTLITTRNPKTMGIPAEPLEVPLLDVDDCMNLLSALSSIKIPPTAAEYEQAREIVKQLGYLPLAIEQAAAYVQEVTGDFATFSEEYLKNRKEVSQWVSTGNRQYEHSVATTWSMSFHVTQKDYPSAARLLQLFAFLNPDGILIEFLQAGINAFDDSLRAVLSNQIEMAKALIELEKLSLIKWDRRNKSISIHRLVQAFITDGMSKEAYSSSLSTVIDLFDEAFPKKVTFEIYPLCRLYQSQVLEPLLRLKTMPSRRLAAIKVRVGVFLREDGKYYDSEMLLVEALQISTDILGPNAPETLVVMLFLAWTYGEQGRGDESIKLYETALEKRIKIMGEEHEKTLIAMHSLAWAYQKQGRNEEAIKLNKDVLERRIRIFGEEHKDTLLTKHNLAWMYLENGRTEEAARLCEEVLAKRLQICGLEHPNTLDTMEVLATAYGKQGRTTEAEKLHKEVLVKRIRIQGGEHPETLTTMHNLAFTFHEQGHDAKALSLEEEVLEKRRRILGNEHPDTVLAIQHLAGRYRDLNRIIEATALESEIQEFEGRLLTEGNSCIDMTM